LLPGVAAEHGWDAPTFLDHVCLKAGLHPSRWQDDDTTLITFEGLAVRGPMGGEPDVGIRFLSDEQIAGYRELCRRNLAAMLFGGTPRYSAPELPDGTICGLIVSLDMGTGARPLQASRIDIRRGMALQASLYQLTQAFATILAQAGASETDLDRLALSILYDPMLHGGLDEPDLRGIQADRRAILVMARGRSSFVYCREQHVEATLRDAAAALDVREFAVATLFSLAADSSEPRLVHLAGPRPLPGPAVRPPAQAGRFYPGEAGALQAMVDELLGPGQATRGSWSAAMVPHAGLRYSGRVAGAVFRRLTFPSTVIIISPKHTGFGVEWAVAPHQEWSIPGARLAGDLDLARRMVETVPGWTFDAAAHQQEHGIEVELPFLARLAPQSRLVGVALGGATFEECRQMGQGLAEAIKDLPEPPLLLISSDMNHFASDAATRQLDELALSCLDGLDAQDLYATCRGRHITMCGMIPAVVVLEALRQLGRLKRAERVAYATTADTTGDKSRVVGYAGMVFG
jgi:AmmeMemoRadiSam system protein B